MMTSNIKLNDPPTRRTPLPTILSCCVQHLLEPRISGTVAIVRCGLAKRASNSPASRTGRFISRRIKAFLPRIKENRALSVRAVRPILGAELDALALELLHEFGGEEVFDGLEIDRLTAATRREEGFVSETGGEEVAEAGAAIGMAAGDGGCVGELDKILTYDAGLELGH